MYFIIILYKTKKKAKVEVSKVKKRFLSHNTGCLGYNKIHAIQLRPLIPMHFGKCFVVFFSLFLFCSVF